MNLVRAQPVRVQRAHHRDAVAHVTADQIPRRDTGVNILQTVGCHGHRLPRQADHRAGGVHHLDQPHDLVGEVSGGIRNVELDGVQAGHIGPDIGGRFEAWTHVPVKNIHGRGAGIRIATPGLNLNGQLAIELDQGGLGVRYRHDPDNPVGQIARRVGGLVFQHLGANLLDIHHALHLNVGCDIAIHDVRGHEARFDILDTSLLRDGRLAKQLNHRPGCILHDDLSNLFDRLVPAEVTNIVHNLILSRFQHIHRPGGHEPVRYVPVQLVLCLGAGIDERLPGLNDHIRLAKQRDHRGNRVHDLNRAHRLGRIPGPVAHAVSHRVDANRVDIHRAGHVQFFCQRILQAICRSRAGIVVRLLGLVIHERLAKQRDHRRRAIHHLHNSSDFIRRVPGSVRHVVRHRVAAHRVHVHAAHIDLEDRGQLPVNAVAGHRSGIEVSQTGLRHLFRLAKQDNFWLGCIHHLNQARHRAGFIARAVLRGENQGIFARHHRIYAAGDRNQPAHVSLHKIRRRRPKIVVRRPRLMNHRAYSNERNLRAGRVDNRHNPTHLISQVPMGINGVIFHGVRSRHQRVDRIGDHQFVSQVIVQGVRHRGPFIQINTPRLHRDLAVTNQTNHRLGRVHHVHRPGDGLRRVPVGVAHAVGHAVTPHRVGVYCAHTGDG